jgi:hypothetical protein
LRPVILIAPTCRNVQWHCHLWPPLVSQSSITGNASDAMKMTSISRFQRGVIFGVDRDEWLETTLRLHGGARSKIINKIYYVRSQNSNRSLIGIHICLNTIYGAASPKHTYPMLPVSHRKHRALIVDTSTCGVLGNAAHLGCQNCCVMRDVSRLNILLANPAPNTTNHPSWLAGH